MLYNKGYIVKLILILVLINILSLFVYFKKTGNGNGDLQLMVENSRTYFLDPFNSPLYLFKTTELVYDYIQLKHINRTDITVELFKELVERGQLKRARNAAFHNIGDCNNVKYLTHNGKDEYIAKVNYTDNGEIMYLSLVYDGVNRGTYNFFNQEGLWITRKLHKIDVYLWVFYGTGGDDPTSVIERFLFFLQPKPDVCQSMEVNK
jgi:hypothetical protein